MKRIKFQKICKILCVPCMIVLSVTLVLLLMPSKKNANDGVSVYFLDVGQGDATLITTPDGNIMIDAGTNAAEVDITAVLKHAGVKSLTYTIFTHAHEDHIGSADTVLSVCRADHVLLPVIGNGDADTYVYQRLLSHVGETTEMNVVTDKTIYSVGDVDIIVYPANTGTAEAEGNQASLVVRIVYKNLSFLIMGDAELEQENALIGQYGSTGELRSTVLRVGHHGSDTSTSDALLEVVSPSYAVISAGAGNSYGHPTGRVISRLEASDIRILRTDTDGTVVIHTDGTSFKIETERN